MGTCSIVKSQKIIHFLRDIETFTANKVRHILDNVVVIFRELNVCQIAPNIVKFVFLRLKLTKECHGLQQRQSTVGTTVRGVDRQHFAIGGETSHGTLRGSWIGSRGLSLGPAPSLRATKRSFSRDDSACFNNGVLRAVGTAHCQTDGCQTSATGRTAERSSGGAGRGGRRYPEQGRRYSLGISSQFCYVNHVQHMTTCCNTTRE